MRFIEVGNSWVNTDNINMLSRRDDGRVMMWLTGYNTPFSIDEPLEEILKKIKCEQSL